MQSSYWRRLFYRWFVEYNPIYLLSAGLVFAGCFLWSRDVVNEGSLRSALGIPLVAEMYAASLIGGAALLTRIGMRRPAVLLALIAIVYQWDTTLHTEACAFLGVPGAVASLVWLVIFAIKLFALGWALRVRFSPFAVASALTAAVGLVLAPRVLPLVGERTASALLAVWVFALVSLHRRDAITSLAPLDTWGTTVLRRVTRAAWIMSAALVGLHVIVWAVNTELLLAPTFIVLPLLGVQRFRRERWVWISVGGALLLAAGGPQGTFFVIAFLAAVALVLRATAPILAPTAIAAAAPPSTPYRAGEDATVVSPSQWVAATLDRAERARAMSGALFATYLGLWTCRWSEGPWPAHVLALDVVLALVIAVAAWRTRVRAPLIVPFALDVAHLVIASRLVPLPRSASGWGATVITLGFVLLGGSLAASYRMRSWVTEGAEPAEAPRPRG